jgi:hypothetical protein
MDGWSDSDDGRPAWQTMLGPDFIAGQDADPDVEVVTVDVIGAGRGITPLLSRLLEYDYVDVLMVVDDNPAAPGMLIAGTMGVSTSQRLDDLLSLLPAMDFVFCGDDHPQVRDRLIEEFLRTGNHRTTFLNPLATRFVMSLTKDARELLGFVPRARQSAYYGFGLGRGPDDSA